MARKRQTIYGALQEPFPQGWEPAAGETILVPTKSGGGNRAVVEKVRYGVVRVRVRAFRNGRQEHLLEKVRPNFYTTRRSAL
jgi:hypothetical protein